MLWVPVVLMLVLMLMVMVVLMVVLMVMVVMVNAPVIPYAALELAAIPLYFQEAASA